MIPEPTTQASKKNVPMASLASARCIEYGLTQSFGGEFTGLSEKMCLGVLEIQSMSVPRLGLASPFARESLVI